MRSWGRFSIHLVAVVSAGPPEGGLYLKPPSSGGLWDGVMTMPSARWSLGAELLPRALLRVRIAWERAGVGGGGGVAEMLVDDGFDVVGGEDFERGGEGGFGEGVGVFGEEEGAGGVLGGAVLDDGLGDGGDVVVVEAGGEGVAAMTGGSEGDTLGGFGW